MPDKTEQILIHLEYIRAKQDETAEQFQALNGRVGTSENRLTAIETRVAIWGAILAAAIASVWATVWHVLTTPLGGK